MVKTLPITGKGTQMKFGNTLRKFQSKRKDRAMTYITANLSREARMIAELTFRILEEKIEREKRIPDEILIETFSEIEYDQHFDKARAELAETGFQQFAFIGKDGQKVYRHKVDKPAIIKALKLYNLK